MVTHRGTPRCIEMIGERFGSLVVLSRAGREHGRAIWECRCDCGVTAKFTGTRLRLGKSTKCKKCLRQSMVTHGATNTPEYNSWLSMLGRCYEPSRFGYKYYGGRGISVCDEWRQSFPAFLRDMGYRPSLDHSLDRIDCNGNYEPGNCRWATRDVQMNNTRRSVRIEFMGECKTIAEWAKDIGIAYSTLKQRLKAWPLERALTTPGAMSRILDQSIAGV